MDWPAGLLAVSRTAFGEHPAISQESTCRDADAFRRARNAATVDKLPKQREGIFAACGAIVRYMAMLDRLEAAAGAESIRSAGASKLHFVWRSGFNFLERKMHAGSLTFERAGLYYNLAALLSAFALEAELQASAHALQVAAGCIREARAQADALNEASTSVTPLTEDMRTPSLLALEHILLGQAQACFAERAAGASLGVQAKLWGQAALYLRDGLAFGLPSSAPKSSRAHIDALAELCLARAHGCVGALRRSERQHGLAAAHLTLAVQLLEGKAKAEGPVRPYAEAVVKPLAVDCEVARRDNDAVYFEREPPAAELAGSIECKSTVRPLPLDKLAAVIGEPAADSSLAGLLDAWLRAKADMATRDAAPADADALAAPAAAE